MRINKFRRLILLIISTITLPMVPIYVDLYYKTYYYIGIILILPLMVLRVILDEKFENKFYERWKKARKKGLWRNAIREGVRSLFIMLVIVSISQLMAYGRSPSEIVSQLTTGQLLWISFFLLLISFIIGVVSWYENNRIYFQLHYSKREN